MTLYDTVMQQIFKLGDSVTQILELAMMFPYTKVALQ